jgi:hypothetical protein
MPGVPGTTGTVPAPGLEDVDEVVARHRAELLALPGVIGVRRGLKVTNGWFSTAPAIVVTVLRKDSAAAQLPKQIEGVLVDVTPATPREQLLSMPLSRRREFDLAAVEDTEEIIRKSRYVPPPSVKLEPITDGMDVLCHVSPDAGWPTLKKFLADVAQRLTVGMYDFTAPHIEEHLGDELKRIRGQFRLILDPKLALGAPGSGPNPKENDKDEVTIRALLEKALEDKFQFEWAAVKLTGKTTAGIFPSAYHIKLAVKDGRAFWLSSGNWQSSNQPDVDPLAPNADTAGIQGFFNREWHAIVTHSGLAQTYEQFLEWDMEQAKPLQAAEPELAELPELLAPPPPEEEAVAAPRFFPPKLFSFGPERPLTIEPLLSPDNYASAVLSLVKSAKRKLYIQNQYIKIGKTNPEEFEALIEAIRDKMSRGLDVRIIVRDLPDTRAQVEALVTQRGFDLNTIKVLPATHTKGVIIDSNVVMIGSHNWSGDGVVYNRDASLVFHDSDIAKYYQDIFLYDWGRAQQKLGHESRMPRISDDEEAIRAGWQRMRWADAHAEG